VTRQPGTYFIIHETGKFPQVFCTKPMKGVECQAVITMAEHYKIVEELKERIRELQKRLR
jgi:hypothetical protein